MYSEKVVSGFFIVLALTLNVGFVYGDIDKIEYHSMYELFAAIVINLIATVMKLGDKTQVGSVLLATSLVADIQLIASASLWGFAANVIGHIDVPTVVAIVSLAIGAVVANVISVILYLGDTIRTRR